MIRKILCLSVLGLLLVAPLALTLTVNARTVRPHAAVAGTSVDIKGFAFNPQAASVKAGGTVTWKNDDGATHHPVADDGSWNAGDVKGGGSVSAKPTKSGKYHCAIHPDMKGSITVNP
jgi:plastocyanin